MRKQLRMLPMPMIQPVPGDFVPVALELATSRCGGPPSVKVRHALTRTESEVRLRMSRVSSLEVVVADNRRVHRCSTHGSIQPPSL